MLSTFDVDKEGGVAFLEAASPGFFFFSKIAFLVWLTGSPARRGARLTVLVVTGYPRRAV